MGISDERRMYEFQSPPPSIDDVRAAVERDVRKELGTTISHVPAVVSVSEADVTALSEQLLPRWPKELNRQQAVEVARVALAYGLDPFMDELIPYQGKPYVTIAGRLRLADDHPQFDGYDLEPATDTERKAFRVADDEHLWKCSVYRKDRRRPTTAFGRAGGTLESNHVAKRWTPEIAQKRAIHRALRAAFPMAIPGAEEALSEAQLRAIHAFDDEAGIDRETRRTVLTETFGVESSNELTPDQASAYIDERVAHSNPVYDAAIEVMHKSLADDGEQFYTPTSDPEPEKPLTEAEAVAVEQRNDIKAKLLADLRIVEDRRDLSTIKRRIRAAELAEDETIIDAYRDAYARLSNGKELPDATQPPLS
jgi:hypothetical protein